MWYTEIDENGFIYRSMYTQNGDAAVYPNHRLLPDSGAPTTGYDPLLQRPECIQPTSPNATHVEYRLVDIPAEEIAARTEFEDAYLSLSGAPNLEN